MNHKGTVTLETERLILRRFELTDAKAMYKNWCADPDVTKYLMWPTHGSIDETPKVLLEVIQSKTYSIFDNLFAGYSEQRQRLLSKSRRISEYDSENLMYKLICEVLEMDDFSKYQAACHVPLNMLIRDVSLLNDEETRYAMNMLTHVDFLLYDSLGKTPVLIIEVDGASYHKKGSRQAERDVLKNRILEKYDLPYLRFRTDGSNEREALIAKLSAVNNK